MISTVISPTVGNDDERSYAALDTSELYTNDCYKFPRDLGEGVKFV